MILIKPIFVFFTAFDQITENRFFLHLVQSLQQRELQSNSIRINRAFLHQQVHPSYLDNA
jgi:hypothetical protein